MDERLTKGEIRKDAVQDAVEATAGTVGQVATILTGAVRDVASAIGGLATDIFEIRDAARRASEQADDVDATER
jgi:hypothetical protein